MQLAKIQRMVGESFIEKAKLDKWYGIVLYIGILAAATSVMQGADLLSRKNLLGFGAGCIFIGLSFFMALKREHTLHQEGVLYRDIIKHSWITIPILLLGLFLIIFFGIKIFNQLS